MDCKYDVQGFLKCMSVKETFVQNQNDVQCGFFTQYSQAKQECDMCCAMNGMVWNGKEKDFYSLRVDDASNSKELKTYCKCSPMKKVNIVAHQDMIANPSRLSQYNKKVWSVGNTSLSGCVDKCLASSSCKYAVLRDKECWLSDLDPALTVSTSKNESISIKKI